MLDSFGYSLGTSHYYAPQATEQNYVVSLEMIEADGSGEGARFIVATQTVPAATVSSSEPYEIKSENVETDVADVSNVVAETPLVSFAVLSTDADFDGEAASVYETANFVEVQIPARRNSASFRQFVAAPVAFAETRCFADRSLLNWQAFDDEERVELGENCWEEACWNDWNGSDSFDGEERVEDKAFETIDLDELFVGADA